MVSYFMPRGRFLIKSINIRQSHQKHQQHQQEKWYMLRHFRQSFSSKGTSSVAQGNATAQIVHDSGTKVDNLIRQSALNLSKGLKKSTHKQKTQQNDHGQNTSWRKWTGFLLRWAPIGFCFFGAIEWEHHRRKCQQQQVPRTASEFQSKVYCSLPLRIISRCWGWLAACYIPTTLRPYLYGWYSKAFGVNLEEALYPDYNYYNSLAEFFTRPLRNDVRPIDARAPLVSPADGKVLHFGSACDSLIEQVKGVNYNIQTFLGPPTWLQYRNSHENAEFAETIKEKTDNTTTLYQCVIYLAPGDYHRFHSPADWQPTIRRHFAGELLSVSPKVATWLPGLFCLNERALYLGKWKYGFFSYTAVGATNVGSVQIYMDDKLKTNRWTGLNVGAHKKREEFDELPLCEASRFKKGDLVGQFNMGSTIVLLFEAPKNFVFNIKAGQKIRVGEPLGHFLE